MKIRNLLVHGLMVRSVVAFFFRPKVEKESVKTGPRHDADLNLSDMLQSASRSSEIYITALSELQELESEPLCHRIAARLLVGNCQLLDGKDEATILTDSGRQIRDFVDAYAASMAICDLQRGRFSIPAACEKFREPTLAQLSLDDQPELHVTTREIDLCISGLGEENSAWSTWISYRHKALRFCEAARADQEKAQNILLYRRLTKVMAKLTYGVEIELQKHMEDLELRVQRAGDVVQGLEPELNRLRAKLAKIEDYVSHDLDQSVQRSGDSINDGLQGAAHLQRMLAVMVQTVLDGNSHIAATQEKSIEFANQKTNEINTWMALMETAATSAFTLNDELVRSRLEVEALSQRQQALSTNLDQLITTTENLSLSHEDHVYAMNEARNLTNDILSTLEEVAENAAVIEEANRSLWGGFGFGGWMPYIVSPVVTLLLGSYGLAPSAIRNLGLVALGEAVVFSLSNFHRILTLSWRVYPVGQVVSSTTGTTF